LLDERTEIWMETDRTKQRLRGLSVFFLLTKPNCRLSFASWW